MMDFYGKSAFKVLILAALIINVSNLFRHICPSLKHFLTPVNSVQVNGGTSNVSDGTSVWCLGKNRMVRSCRFKNLCYSNILNTFLFLRGPKTETIGINIERGEGRTYGLGSLTAVWHGFHFHARRMDVDKARKIHSGEDVIIHGKYFFMRRSVSSNIFHAFHDDLLPIFYTLYRRQEHLSRTLFFLDDTNEEFFPEFYRAITKGQPLLKMDLQFEPSESLVCFEDAYVGLSRDSIWYQHGSRVPEGLVEDVTVTSRHLRYFQKVLTDRMNIKLDCSPSDEDYGILLSRKQTRKIINEKELLKAIQAGISLNMIELSLEVDDVNVIIEKISCSKLLIGMHGALLVLGMFLKSNSVLLEMFPYALNPDLYTDYKAMAQLPGMEIEYLTWRNMNVSRTVTHGFDNLHLKSPISEGEKERILTNTEVPTVRCCHNPELSFRRRQDTVVDVPEVISTLKSSDWYFRRNRTHPLS